MDTLPIARYRFFQQLDPISVLQKINTEYANGHLQVFSPLRSWSFYTENSKIIYACYSDNMLDLLSQNIRYLIDNDRNIYQEICHHLQRILSRKDEDDASFRNKGYLAICWLVHKKYINPQQAGALIENLALDLMRSFLSLEQGSYDFTPKSFLEELPKFNYIDWHSLVEGCQKSTETINKQLLQRQYRYSSLLSNDRLETAQEQNRDLSLARQKTSQNIHHTQKTAMKSSQNMEPDDNMSSRSSSEQPNKSYSVIDLVDNYNSILPDKVSGVDINVQSLNQQINDQNNSTHLIDYSQIKSSLQINDFNYQSHDNQSSIHSTKYTIVCIDDSPAVLNAIKNYLDDQIFSVVGIKDPLKALMQIIRLKPDLVLLDIGMPNLDGYELCSLLRKHSYFKSTPVIMVTGRTGFVDRAKAKLVRASGYLTKPFTQGDLLKVVFQHLDIL